MINDETNALDPEILERISKLLDDEIVTKEKLIFILDTLKKRGERKRKKERKKISAESLKEEIEVRLDNPAIYSYAQSLKVWGQELVVSEKSLNRLSPPHKNPVFKDSRFNFKQVVLQGLSPKEMAQRFPGHSWNSHRHNDNKLSAGHYLVSLENPLSNLTPTKEKELRPKDCYRLDFNLTIELLLTLNQLGFSVPELFYRTTLINGHNQEVCVGLQKGKIIFMEAKKANAEKKMGLCLVKAEKWMDE